jgi:hypothetical protein
LSLIAIVLGAGACGTSVRYTPLYRTRVIEPRPASEVDVFLSEPPRRPHRDVGLLEAEQESEFSDDGTREMLAELRKVAGDRGCDAIFVKGLGSNAKSVLWISDTTTSTKTVTASCIEYRDDRDD